MRKYRLWIVASALIVTLFGCSHSEEALNDPVKPPGDSPYDNSAPGAKSALPAPGPPSNVPSPGGVKRRSAP